MTKRGSGQQRRRLTEPAWARQTAARIRREVRHLRQVGPPSGPEIRRETLAACLSICPGLGQVFNGQFFRGLLFFVGTIVLLGVGLGFLVWAWSAWHAYHTARDIRLGHRRRTAAPLPPRLAPAPVMNAAASPQPMPGHSTAEVWV